MKTILLYKWNEVNDAILERNLKALGYGVVPFDMQLNNYDMDGKFSLSLMTLIHKNKCDICMSFNYIPLISAICDVIGIPYVSWVYDSPNLTLFSKLIRQSCNYIFEFDKSSYQRLQERGVVHSYHMPLAVDTAYFDEQAKKPFGKKHEVCFLGSLYTNEHNYFDAITDWDSTVYEVCQAAVAEQKFCYHEDRIRDMMTEEIISYLVEKAGLSLGGKYEETPLDLVAMMMHKKVTVEERRELLIAVSEQFETAIYTGSDTKNFPKLKNMGRADYLTEMPQVFYNSKINLNITLRSIESGIPLRALDVMACGGFLLSNYQPELAEYFEDGKELVLYHDLDDCLSKIAYYLEHEEERIQIAKAGQEKVREYFSYERKLKEIFAIVEGNL